MEIRQLEYFLAVKNAGSFTRAAEHLYVSHPAVTSAIRSLESELGITLFDRSQGKASLTAEGRIFSAHVEEIMKGVVTTIRDMDAMKSLSRVHRVLTAGSADTIRGLLLAMDSAAILPASIFEGDSRLAEIPLAPEIVISPVYAENARRTPSRAARAFSDSIN